MRRNAQSTKSNEEDITMTQNKSRKGGKPRRGKGIRDKKSLDDTTKSGNDPRWYAADPNILRDAASYPFSYNTGATEIHNYDVWGASSIQNKPAQQIPGICSFHVYPTIGTAIEATDPINVAAQSVYSFVRHANSGHSNYDSSDLMIYILAMANMYSFLVWCQRLYGYALTYDQRNRYIPNDLIRTNNVDASDLVNNLANFRFWINTLIAKMASFAVPATMSIFSRMSFIYSDYYVEGTSIKEQLYQFVPEGFYKFGLDADQAGRLTWEPFDFTTLMKTQDIITYGEDLFNAIWSQEDFGIMSGDILKAYGDRIIKLTSLPEYYTIAPKFDAMVLTQMKNADLVRIDPGNISQNPTYGIIVQTLVPKGFVAGEKWSYYSGAQGDISAAIATMLNNCMVAALKDYRILTVDTDAPNPDIVIEATRLKVAYDPIKSWYKAGTEVVTGVTVTYAPGTDLVVNAYTTSYYQVTDDKLCLAGLTQMLSETRHFHYMPRIWSFMMDVVANKFDALEYFDIDNFTLLSYDDVRKLHEAATINMFAVPSIGKV